MLATPKTAALHCDTSAFALRSHVTNVAPNPGLITERQVKCGKVTALGAPRPATPRRYWVTALWQRLVERVSGEGERRRHYPPRRISYFEQAATAREMDRL